MRRKNLTVLLVFLVSQSISVYGLTELCFFSRDYEADTHGQEDYHLRLTLHSAGTIIKLNDTSCVYSGPSACLRIITQDYDTEGDENWRGKISVTRPGLPFFQAKCNDDDYDNLFNNNDHPPIEPEDLYIAPLTGNCSLFIEIRKEKNNNWDTKDTFYYNIYRDTSGPTISLNAAYIWDGNSQRPFFFTVTDDLSGVSSISVQVSARQLNGASVAAEGITHYYYSGNTYYFYPQSNGTYTISAADSFGNSSATSFLLPDGTAPTLSHNIPNASAAYEPGLGTVYTVPVSNQANFTVTASEINGDTGIKYIYCGENTTNLTSEPINVATKTIVKNYNANMPSGDYTWIFSTTDYASHSTQFAVKQRLLLNPPSLSTPNFTQTDSHWYNATNRRISIKAWDNLNRIHAADPATVQLFYSVDGSDPQTQITRLGTSWSGTGYDVSGTGDYLLIPIGEGRHTLRFKVKDEAGNTKKMDPSIPFNVDISPPMFDLKIHGDQVTWTSVSESYNSWEAGPYYINDTSLLTEISIKDSLAALDDANSGLVNLTVFDGIKTKNLYSDPKASETNSDIDKFSPSVGDYSYTFTLQDLAGNSETKTLQLLYDPAPIVFNDISFSLTDENSTANPKRIETIDNSVGNFSNLCLSVKEQASGTAQPASYTWTDTWTGGSNQGAGNFTASTNRSYTALLSPGLLSEGYHSISVVVVDQCGNRTDKSFTFTVDRTAPVIAKEWIKIADDGGSSTSFTLDPSVSETEILVYQTGSDYDMEASSAKLLWDKGTLLGGDGKPITGSFTLASGKGRIYLCAMDPARNRAASGYTVLRPDPLPAPSLSKVVSQDHRFFMVQVTSTVPGLTLDGIAYTVRYEGVGVTAADGSTLVPQAIAQTAQGNPFQWNIAALGSGAAKACAAGFLGYLKAYGVLEPQTYQSDTVIALKRQGLPKVYAIPNSPPYFCEPEAWPDFLGAEPTLTCPMAVDPDGHRVWYRLVVHTNTGSWTYEVDEGKPPETPWSFHLVEGGTIYLEAWAGQDTPWDKDVSRLSRVYDAAQVDLEDPEIPELGSPWALVPRWTKAVSFTAQVRDVGSSGLASVVMDLSPWSTEGEEDSESGRPSYTLKPGGFSPGAGEAALTVALPADLRGLYRLSVTVTDRAGNSRSVSSAYANFDHEKPTVDAVMTRPFGGAATGYYADSLGALTAALQGEENLSGPAHWGYQTEGSSWVWSSWKGSAIAPEVPVAFSPHWCGATRLKVRFALRDRAGNESLPTGWSPIYYEKNPPEFSLLPLGLSEPAYVSSLEALDIKLSPEDLTGLWTLVRMHEDGSESLSSPVGSWAALQSTAALWEDGGRYKARVMVRNVNGVEARRESDPFILDRTAPPELSLALSGPTDRSRTKYYRNEPFIVSLAGGKDPHTPVIRSIGLYQNIGINRREINTLMLGPDESRVSMNWGRDAIAWSEGGFYVESRAVNAAGLERVSPALPIAVEGEGLSVYLPSYNGGIGLLSASWSAGTIQGIRRYRYQLWIQGSTDQSLSAGMETMENSILVDLSPYDLAEGDKLFITVDAYDETDTLVGKGSSPVSITDKGEPILAWTMVPQSVTSSRVWARFTALPSSSGLSSARFLVEKLEGAGTWTVLPDTDGSPWRHAQFTAGGELSADLSDLVAAGDMVNLTVLVENAVGRAAQLSTGALPVDDSPPPEPVVLDQGEAVNQLRQNLSFHWKFSEPDRESGVDHYAWGWFFKGLACEPSSWTEAAQEELSASLELKGMPVQDTDGKILVFAVKATNLAGLSSIGYSDGILLDSTAPLIDTLRVYGKADWTTELSGYVTPAAVPGNSAYLGIDALEEESWLDGGNVYAYRFDKAEYRWVQVGSPVTLVGSKACFTLPEGLSHFMIGEMWRFEACAVDAAGNVSAKALSDGFIVEGGVPPVAGLSGFMDTQRIYLSWNLGSGGDERWISHYFISARCGSTLITQLSSLKAISFIWGEGGLNLLSGSTVQFTVTAFSHTGASVSSDVLIDYQITMTIDGTPPEFDIHNTTLPMSQGTTLWYDRVDGHLAYNANRGISTLQWRAVRVPGEIPLVDWQDKRWVSLWDFEKPFCEINEEPLSAWDGAQIRLAFRAANSMGIYSEVTNMDAVKVDTTEPEKCILTRFSAYSKEVGSVSGWTLELQDSQSGIMSYMAALVPVSQATGMGGPGSYTWPDTAVNNPVPAPGPEVVTQLTIAIPLTQATEGLYTPLVRVRNGTGHWNVYAFSPITIDRTSPDISSIEWPGAPEQKLTVDGAERIVRVSNGPTQVLMAQSNEEVTWSLSGAWFLAQTLPSAGYDASLNTTLDFADHPAGTFYPLTITLEDQAGNQGAFNVELRYNRAPVITVNTEALTTNPGLNVALKNLIAVTDDENDREGDYALSFRWDPGNGASVQNWTGGTSLGTVFGSGAAHTTAYLQAPSQAQTTGYTAMLTVTDRYGKATTVSLPMTVENTRAGTLSVDEYWTGPYEIRGWVVIPLDRTLTLEQGVIQVNASLSSEGFMDGGILVMPGGKLLVDESSINSCMEGVFWKGIRAGGLVSGSKFTLSLAERALVLEDTGNLQLSDSSLEKNLIGIHLLGGMFLWEGGCIEGNEEYGIKEDGVGAFTIRNALFSGNGVQYYRHGVFTLRMDEINGLAGNGGNREVR